MCGMNSVKIKKIKVKKYNCDSVNGNLEKMAIGNRVIRYVFRGKFNSYNSHFLFFIKIFSSYSCDSPDKNDYIKHDVIDLIFLYTFSIGGKKKSKRIARITIFLSQLGQIWNPVSSSIKTML